MTKRWVAVGGLALLLLNGMSALAEEPYDIHVVEALTGGGAFLGKEEQQALQLLEKTVNKAGGIQGRPLRFVFHDDQSTPQLAVQLTNEVLALHPAVMMGSSLVATCNAMLPMAQNGPVMYCFSAASIPRKGAMVSSPERRLSIRRRRWCNISASKASPSWR